LVCRLLSCSLIVSKLFSRQENGPPQEIELGRPLSGRAGHVRLPWRATRVNLEPILQLLNLQIFFVYIMLTLPLRHSGKLLSYVCKNCVIASVFNKNTIFPPENRQKSLRLLITTGPWDHLYICLCRRSSIYHLTGVLIHIGDDAHQGHYKAHIRVKACLHEKRCCTTQISVVRADFSNILNDNFLTLVALFKIIRVLNAFSG
jgi:hypothetical protein